MKYQADEDEIEEIEADTGKLHFFKTLGKAFYPPAYKEFSLRTWRRVLSYFFAILFISFLIMVLVGIPVIWNMPSAIDGALSKFSALSFNATVKMNAPLELPPLGMKLDLSGQSNLTSENILITDKDIQFKKPICYFGQACLIIKDNAYKIDLAKFSAPLENKDYFNRTIFLLVLFLLPSILVLLFIYLSLKYLLISAALALLGYIFLKIVRRRLKFGRIWKSVIYSMTPFIIAATGNIPLGLRLLSIPFLITLLFLLLGLIQASERGSRSFQ